MQVFAMHLNVRRLHWKNKVTETENHREKVSLIVRIADVIACNAENATNKNAMECIAHLVSVELITIRFIQLALLLCQK